MNPARYNTRHIAAVSIVLLAWSVPAAAQQSGPSPDQTIFDLIAETQPATTLKKVNVFRDHQFGPGTACEWRYGLGDQGVTQSLGFLPAESDSVYYAFRKTQWSILTWTGSDTTQRVFSLDLPSLCQNKTPATATQLISKDKSTATILVDYSGISRSHDDRAPDARGPAESVTFGPSSVTMQINTFDYFRQLFGHALYPAWNPNPKPGDPVGPFFQLGRNFLHPQRLADYSALNFKFVAHLDDASIKTTPMTDYKGALPYGASLFPNPHNFPRFYVALPVRWEPQFCRPYLRGDVSPTRLGAACRDYFATPLNVLTSYFMQQAQYWTGPVLGFDPVNLTKHHSVIIYRQNALPLIPGRPAQNPFEIVGKQAVAQIDIKPILRNAVVETRALADKDAKIFFPPRVYVNDNGVPVEEGGRPETDAEYIDDFVMDYAGLTFEVPGLASMSYTIHAFQLTGVPTMASRP